MNKGYLFGNFTSQWFANFYLQDIDHYIKEKLKVSYYIRYMDDMVLFGRNKKELHKVKDELEKYLKREGLKLKENWQLFKVDSRPIDFLRLSFLQRIHNIEKRQFFTNKKKAKKDK